MTLLLTGVATTLKRAEHSSAVMKCLLAAPQNGQLAGLNPIMLKPQTRQTCCSRSMKTSSVCAPEEPSPPSALYSFQSRPCEAKLPKAFFGQHVVEAKGSLEIPFPPTLHKPLPRPSDC